MNERFPNTLNLLKRGLCGKREGWAGGAGGVERMYSARVFQCLGWGWDGRGAVFLFSLSKGKARRHRSGSAGHVTPGIKLNPRLWEGASALQDVSDLGDGLHEPANR